jgi:hypothetical protein
MGVGTPASLVLVETMLRAMAERERQKRDEARRVGRDWAALMHGDRVGAFEEAASAVLMLWEQPEPAGAAGAG